MNNEQIRTLLRSRTSVACPCLDQLQIMFWITDFKDQLESKIDSTLSKVEGLMAKSGEIENRFNEVDNIHQEIKGSMQSMTCNVPSKVTSCDVQ